MQNGQRCLLLHFNRRSGKNRIFRMTLKISFVDPDRQAVALRLLFARFPVDEQQQRLTDAMMSVERGQLNIDGLLLAEENDRPIGVTLMMIQRDGVTLVWPPVVTCQTTDAAVVENALMTRLCEEIDRSASKLAQALLPTDDVTEVELLKRHQFVHLADMFFLARRLEPNGIQMSSPDGGFQHETFNDVNANRFASVIERTYQGSLDCPFLDGFRNGADALASHRLSGKFDPASWRLYRIGDDDIGVLLLNEHPEQDAIELVYFGIVPEFRGQGLGRQLLDDGVHAAALTGRAVMFLAVDCGNVYANALYSELGFDELVRRRVMVRRSPQLARE